LPWQVDPVKTGAGLKWYRTLIILTTDQVRMAME
jgi:hypothetical protein